MTAQRTCACALSTPLIRNGLIVCGICGATPLFVVATNNGETEVSSLRLPADAKNADSFNRACLAGRVAGARKRGRTWVCTVEAWACRAPALGPPQFARPFKREPVERAPIVMAYYEPRTKTVGGRAMTEDERAVMSTVEIFRSMGLDVESGIKHFVAEGHLTSVQAAMIPRLVGPLTLDTWAAMDAEEADKRDRHKVKVAKAAVTRAASTAKRRVERAKLIPN